MSTCRRCAMMLSMMMGSCAHPVEQQPEVVELSARRSTAFGAEAGEGLLSSVWGVAAASDGRVMVSEPEFARVVEFDSDGSFVRVVGGRGKGPGEFQVPGALTWRGDSLAVTDFLQGVSLFSSDGRFATRINFTIQASAGPFGGRPMLALPDGSVAATVPADQSDVVSGAVTHEPWLKVTRGGDVFDTLAWVPQAGRYYSAKVKGAERVGVHPFAWNPLLAIPPDGSSFIIVERSPAHTAEADSFRVIRVNIEGDTADVGFIPYVPTPIPALTIDSVADAMAARWAGRLKLKPASVVGSIKSEVTWPEWYPPVTAVLAGADGSVWLRREVLSGEFVEWDVLDENLDVVGRIDLPSGLDIKVVALDKIYAVELDEFDVPTVIRLDIAGGT